MKRGLWGNLKCEPRSKGQITRYLHWVVGFAGGAGNSLELPWGLSSKESACQCGRYRFDPWSVKITHAKEQVSPGTTTTESVLSSLSSWSLWALELVLRNKRRHRHEKPMHSTRESPLLATAKEKPSSKHRRLSTIKIITLKKIF